MSNREPSRVSLVRIADGTTTCCDAYSTVFVDDGIEYCKGCGNDIAGYVWPRSLTTK